MWHSLTSSGRRSKGGARGRKPCSSDTTNCGRLSILLCGNVESFSGRGRGEGRLDSLATATATGDDLKGIRLVRKSLIFFIVSVVGEGGGDVI